METLNKSACYLPIFSKKLHRSAVFTRSVFQPVLLVARRATYVVDGRFFGHFFWKVEGSSVHTSESSATHMCHVQLTHGKLLYGGGEPSRVSRVAINMHVTTIWWRGALTCRSHVSCVARVAINMHVTTIWWRGALMCGSRVSRVAHVSINMHVTTIWWRGALTCG